MKQRGRKSAAALTVVAAVQTRLGPPRTLTDPQRALWLEIVNSRPAEWFGPEQIKLLAAYCRHAIYGDMLAGELDKAQPGWLGDDDGLHRHRDLLAMHEKETRAMSSLATRLRITNQALYDNRKAGRTAEGFERGRKPWQLEADEE